MRRGDVAYALALSAGVTIYVAASDLIPEVNREGAPSLGWTVFGGLVVFAAVDWLLEHTLGWLDRRSHRGQSNERAAGEADPLVDVR
jgi:hypothetical protein